MNLRILRNFKKILHAQATISGMLSSSNRELFFQEKIEQLTSLALNCKEKGITADKLCDEEIIVSLTTFGGRFYDCYVAIESIMQGTVKPNRIVLWISEEMKGISIPVTLQNQIKRGLEIHYCKDIRSYTKLIPSLKEFPNASIITVDDDIIYPYDTIENLINVHNKHKGMICANVIRPLPDHFGTTFKTWAQLGWAEHYLDVCQNYILEGYGGVLYPPKTLNEEVFNEDVFLDICKYADDIWFSAMAMLNKTPIIFAYPHLYFFNYYSNPNVQSIALSSNNVNGPVLNDIQLKQVMSKYGLG